MKRRVGIEGRACTKPVEVSADLKNLVLHKMLQTLDAISSRRSELDLTKFHGQWAQLWVNHHSFSQSRLPKVVQHVSNLIEVLARTKKKKESSEAPQRAPEVSMFQDLGFVESVFLWHIVTELCLRDDQADTDTTPATATLDDQADTDTTTTTASSSSSKDYKLKSSIRELSNYVMYLLVKCKAMVTVYDIDSLNDSPQTWLQYMPLENDQQIDRRSILKNIRKNIRNGDEPDVCAQAFEISRVFLQMGKEEGLWDLIAMVWVEMLCYIAFNYDAAFHTKQLCAGGEFVTYVKMLLVILKFSF
jgi:hypothetical protein